MNANTVFHTTNVPGPVRLLEGERQLQSEAREGAADLCQDSLLLTEALTVAHNAPDVREDLVASLRARVASGEYGIDSLALATAIVGENPGLFRV